MPSTQEPTDAAAPASVAFVSLGCPKNLVDSEKMLGTLAEAGVLPVPADDDYSGADAVVINTCGFLEASKTESIEQIELALDAKKQGKIKRVVVAGCLVQRHRAKLLDWCPGIDALIGVYDRDKILDAVSGPDESGLRRKADRDVKVELPVYSSIAASATLAAKDRQLDQDPDFKGGYFESDAARLRLTPRHWAYLRMSEGCNQNCAFCTIPSIRGKMRSKPLDAIVPEMVELLHDGVFEVNLIGQDTTSYGEDIPPGIGGHGSDTGLVRLLTTLDKTITREVGPGSTNGWLRLMYAYPSCFTDAMIDAIARLDHVVKYIDMPLQHINGTVLDNMRRKTSRQLIETLLQKLRDRIPGIAIRTTFISGFPGETPEQHQELVDFVRDFGFDAMGVFPYSPEPGTPAGRMHQTAAVPDGVIQERVDELMLTQQEVAFDRAEQLAEDEAELDVLIDGPSEMQEADEDGNPLDSVLFEARHTGQAPQIDAVTLVRAAGEDAYSPGELVRCKVIGASGYDLVAEPVSGGVDDAGKRSLPILN